MAFAEPSVNLKARIRSKVESKQPGSATIHPVRVAGRLRAEGIMQRIGTVDLGFALSPPSDAVDADPRTHTPDGTTECSTSPHSEVTP